MTRRATGADPLDINSRLYKQLGRLLDDMEKADRDETMSFPQRIAALIAVGRVQKIFADLRKANLDVGAGSAVAKYSAAFAANAVGQRTADGTVVQLSGRDADTDADDDFNDDDV